MVRKTPLVPLVTTFVGIIATLYLLQTITPANRILGLRRDGFEDATKPADMSPLQVTMLVLGVIVVLGIAVQAGTMFGIL